MTDDAERWKEKYFKSLEQQEKLERRWDARLDLLRRGLVRSSLAAEGSDQAVDQCMKEMREVIRSDSMDGGLAALIPRLEKAVLDSEHRRETRMNQVREALTSLVQQLQSLPLPGEQLRALKKLSKKLDGGVSQSRELPPLLGELSGLQERALASLHRQADEARPGFLQRLFGTRDAEPAASEPEQSSVAQAAAAAPAVGEAGAPLAPVPPAALEAAVPAPEGPAVASPDPETPAALPVSAMPEPVPAAAVTVASPISAPASAEQAEAPIAQPSGSEPLDADAAAPAPGVPEGAPVPQTDEQAPVATPPPADAASDDPSSLAAASLTASADGEGAGKASQPVTDFGPALTTVTTPPVVSSPTVEPLPSGVEPIPAPAQAIALAPLTDTFTDASGEDGPYALPHAVEPPYSQVAAHIEHTLLGLLDDLSLPERYKDQALAMRERVARGLNWYELIPILDDLAVLMLAVNDSGQHEFEAYLQALNARLEAFHAHLRDASAGHADHQTAARQLDSQLREQVDGLQHSVQGAQDLASLKQVLDSRLEGLLGTLDQHRQARDHREQDLAERLQGLAARVASMEQEALGYREHLEEQRQKALVDPLTGLPNRAAWSERLTQEMQAWQTQGGHLSMAILDLDHFKRINDGYGHLAGDKVLKLVANVLRKRLRGSDFMARFGGEEFVLLMPQTPLEQATRQLESLRAAVEACPFHFKGEPVTITTSIGCSVFRSGESGEAVLGRADKALYRAKAQGRNRVEQG
ncbi:diguanylate cyclase [Pseudomonas sp. UBA6562]|uniref:diguanylate cyclase n=1 Tax=Pseudomonas sp. UBA6562 TaxID=1947332 RepID=UPI0025DAF1F3|nr:diguanylate cyclase [Pseudomonas sp. UBA6562]